MGFFDSVKNVAGVLNPVTAIGTGLSMGGDLLAYDAARKAGRSAERGQSEANRIALHNAERDRELQELFARMGIRWRVEDAKAAGLHPLAALGAGGASYSPSSLSLFTGAEGGKYRARSEFASRMGQNISRAAMAMATPHERTANRLQEERLGLENDLLRAQITKIHRDITPGFPSDYGVSVEGQGDSRIQEVPVYRTASPKGQPWMEKGHVSDYAFSYTPYGLAIVPSRDVKERIEEQFIPQAMWTARNVILPNFPGRQFPYPTVKEYPLPEANRRKGYRSWRWMYSLQQFVPSKAPEGAGFLRRQKARWLNK